MKKISFIIFVFGLCLFWNPINSSAQGYILMSNDDGYSEDKDRSEIYTNPHTISLDDGFNGYNQNESIAKISPNPFNETLNLDYETALEGVVSISIFNAQGQLVEQMMDRSEVKSLRQTFDTSQWTSGIYYCTIQSKSTSKTFRLIKAN